MHGAVDVPTTQTLSWLRDRLGSRPRRILEIGCGGGEVAAALTEAGHRVLALDNDDGCVERTAARGVATRRASFPQFDPGAGEGPFDVVLFTRVLHHLPDLRAVCSKTEQLLSAGGSVLIEDFDWERVDEATAAWIFGILGLGRELGIVPPEEWDWSAPPIESWRAQYRDHDLHGGETMRAALAERFQVSPGIGVPYAYRWFARYLQDDPRGLAVTRAVLEAETELIRTGAIVPIGLRLVARVGGR